MKKKVQTILVVDDEVAICNLEKKILTSRDCEVATAQNGEAALEILGKMPVDLMVVDLKMPLMGGLELLERARKKYPQLKSILVTAYGTPTSAREAMSLGVCDFITKPFDNDLLKKVVREALLGKH